MDDRKNPQPIRVSIEEAKALYDRGEAAMLDVVDAPVYDQFSYQIASAVRIAPEELHAQYTRLPRDKAVFAY